MILTEPEIDLTTLAEVDVPALVLQGDRDEVTIDCLLYTSDAADE